jgi:hypothetical protein
MAVTLQESLSPLARLTSSICAAAFLVTFLLCPHRIRAGFSFSKADVRKPDTITLLSLCDLTATAVRFSPKKKDALTT